MNEIGKALVGIVGRDDFRKNGKKVENEKHDAAEDGPLVLPEVPPNELGLGGGKQPLLVRLFILFLPICNNAKPFLPYSPGAAACAWSTSICPQIVCGGLSPPKADRK